MFNVLQERAVKRESLFFLDDETKRIDYVLVYTEPEGGPSDIIKTRELFLDNLHTRGVDFEIRDKSVITSSRCFN